MPLARNAAIRAALAFAGLLLLLIAPQALFAGSAHAMKIQKIKSPGGIEAWLVEEHTVPLVAMNFGFRGGASQDPANKDGVAHFLTTILDEGAGDMDAAKFQERMEDHAIKMRFNAGRDSFTGSFEALSANLDAGIELLRLALNKPRFEADAVDRMRKQLIASIAFGERDPDKVASREWFRIAFDGHPYAREIEGTRESLATITREDLEAYRQRVFARDTLKVTAVGAIDAKRLGALLDKVFGELPAKGSLTEVAMAKPPVGPKRKVVEMPVPQSVVQFGHAALLRKDPDFMAAFVLNYILGGGGFNSRLMEEVREKRGLAYSVSSYIHPYDHAAVYVGGVATKNEAVEQSIEVIKAELKRMAESGPTETELTNAKSYLTGSYPLRFDTNSKIANQLQWIQMEELGIDYVEKRNGLVEAVTMDDLKRVARSMIRSDGLIITIVGQPVSASGGEKPAKSGKEPGKS